MRAALILLLVLMTAAPARPARADALEETVRDLSLGIDDIRVLSGWRRADASGLYRVVVGHSFVEGAPVSRLFVQWLAVDGEGKRRLLDSFEIKEVAALKAQIGDYTHESGEDELALYLEMVGNPEAEGGYELFIRSPADYRFGRLSN